MSLHKRMVCFGVLDSIIVFTSIYLSIWMLFPSSPAFTLPLFSLSLLMMVSHLVLATVFNLYKRAWEYASVSEVVVLVKSVTFSIMIAATLQFLLSADVYVRVLATTWLLQIVFISGSRFSWRLIQDKKKNIKRPEGKRTLIIGAGMAGTLIARQLQQKEDCDLIPVAFVDDDIRKNALHIHNVPVVGGTEHLDDVVRDLAIEKIIIAIPSLTKKERQDMYELCQNTGIDTITVPMFEDLVTGKLTFNDMKKVDVNHLLGRPPVDLDLLSMKEFIEGRTILVTGAGGSIGSEICRQISPFLPSKLILLGHGENSIYTIHRELIEVFGDRIEVLTEIADIKDRERMIEIMSTYQPAVVLHAAAHKHVPLMERNPMEAVTNNILGTKNTAEAADLFGVETFVMISSDKAVNPTSVMGSTKRIAEMVIQDLNKRSLTKFVAVRFGNVLGSRGSVVPLFIEQIQKGGPVTVTDAAMTRYFMTIPEASRLVLQAGALGEGGEIFVLDMGEPVKIVDLARNLITLCGFSEKEIGIHYSGIRPGEKLYEELLNENEVEDQQIYPRIYLGKTVDVHIDEVMNLVDGLAGKENAVIRETLLGIANGKVVREAVM